MKRSEARANLRRVLARTIEYLSGTSDNFIDVLDGVMIAFYPPITISKKLAIEGGEPPEDMHITLALPGKLSSLSPEQKRRLPVVVRGFAMISRPLSGTISGLTDFPAHDGKKPIVYLLDIPGLSAWRQRLVEILVLNGYSVASDHGFIPHMTLKYAEVDEPIAANNSNAEIEFDKICLMMGDKRKEYLLGGNPEIDEAMDSFSDTRGGGPGRPTTEEASVNQYQRDLEDAYDEWADEAARQLARELDAEKRNALLAALLLLLLARLREIAYTELPNAIAIGLDGEPGSPDVYAQVAEVMTENDAALRNSLIPAIQIQMQNALTDPAILNEILAAQAAVVAGNPARREAAFAAVRDALRAQAGLMRSRVTQYSGTWWALMNYAIGTRATSLGQRIRWTRDPQAQHCRTCLDYGERIYASFAEMMDITGGISPADGTDCRGNCRCILEIVD